MILKTLLIMSILLLLGLALTYQIAKTDSVSIAFVLEGGKIKEE
jgi:hypothetical protein